MTTTPKDYDALAGLPCPADCKTPSDTPRPTHLDCQGTGRMFPGLSIRRGDGRWFPAWENRLERIESMLLAQFGKYTVRQNPFPPKIETAVILGDGTLERPYRTYVEATHLAAAVAALWQVVERE